MPTKAVAATGSISVAGAISTLVIAIWMPWADATVATALTTLIGAVLAGVATYLTKAEGA